MPKFRIATIVGARPQFVKAAPFSRVWRRRHTEILIHTGQHYDKRMSNIFFRELRIPKPDYHLGIGGGTNGWQTGKMLEALSRLLPRLKLNGLLVYGDTNSTLAGALAGAQSQLPVFHVEAGLRSFRRDMPEETNRVLTDHVSHLMFAPTPMAIRNLRREGIVRGVVRVGDVMYDAFRLFAPLARRRSLPAGIKPPYALATVHRAEATGSKAALTQICRAFGALPVTVAWPLHPRTRKALKQFRISVPRNVRFLEPVGYLDSLRLQSLAQVVLTDSGGVQKEAYFQRRPCVTLRRETEWTETVQTGHNILAGQDARRIVAAYHRSLKTSQRPWPALFGNGRSAERIAREIERYLEDAQ